MKHFLLTTSMGVALATVAQAEPVTYMLDASHSQIVFSYNHLGVTQRAKLTPYWG